MLTKDMAIGVIDSGVGGLSVLKTLTAKMPSEDFIYLGDTARTPYGSRSEEEVRKFVEQMLTFFDTQNVKLVVIACNTITVLGPETLQKLHKYQLVGMSKGEKLVLAASPKKNIAVFATEFTIGTKAHEKAIRALDSRAKVTGIPCPKFVPLIEGEKFDSPEVTEAIEEYANTAKQAGADTVILSCTHFPFLRKDIERILGRGVTVIDPAEQTATDAQHRLIEEGLLKLSGTGNLTICFTKDTERGQRLAQRMMPGVKATYKRVTLE
jgi:glutamate racemase